MSSAASRWPARSDSASSGIGCLVDSRSSPASWSGRPTTSSSRLSRRYRSPLSHSRSAGWRWDRSTAPLHRGIRADPPHMRGRVIGVLTAGAWAAIPAGILLGAILVDALGVAATLRDRALLPRRHDLRLLQPRVPRDGSSRRGRASANERRARGTGSARVTHRAARSRGSRARSERCRADGRRRPRASMPGPATM